MLQTILPREQTHMSDLAIAASRNISSIVFDDYKGRQSHNTLINQRRALDTFSVFLSEASGQLFVPTGTDLQNEPQSWTGISGSLIRFFVKWLSEQGYAVGTINVKLAAVKTYASLAVDAGVVDPSEGWHIKRVKGYSHKEGRRHDEQREKTRYNTSKNRSVIVPAVVVDDIINNQPATPKGRRNRLLYAILFDHGLRASELTGLTVGSMELAERQIVFYRSKVDLTQTHKMTDRVYRAALAYMALDKSKSMSSELLFNATSKDRVNLLQGSYLNRHTLSRMVNRVGKKMAAKHGIERLEKLSAHDCRHTWATAAARAGTPIDRLKQAGGWKSLAMPMRYIEDAQIANQGVLLK